MQVYLPVPCAALMWGNVGDTTLALSVIGFLCLVAAHIMPVLFVFLYNIQVMNAFCLFSACPSPCVYVFGRVSDSIQRVEQIWFSL